MVRALERGAERWLAADAPVADAIVVLSAGRVIAAGKAAVSEWGDADRYFGGLELFRAGKAPLLVFTGGVAPWEAGASPEGEILAGYAKAMGVSAERIAITGRVMSTAEEAVAVAKLLRERRSVPASQGAPLRVLLVTSAFHMPRARRLFERTGLAVAPFPVDFRSSRGVHITVLDFLPTAAALGQTEFSMREMYGRLFYLVFLR